MKTFTPLILFFIVALSMFSITNGQNVSIPDVNFKSYLLGNMSININGDNEIQVTEANQFMDSINCSNMNIVDLTGIEDFISITCLDCSNNLLTSIDISNNLLLTHLACNLNELIVLDTSQNSALSILNL